ncbi:hypothetical protein NQ314_007506, partial [Rhamnusium bicolor]
ERVEEDNQKQLNEMVKNLISSMDNKAQYRINNYEELLKQLWDKYRDPYEEDHSLIDKRYYYPNFGVDVVDLHKRSRYNDEVYPKEDNVNDFRLNYLKKRYYQNENNLNRIRQIYSKPYMQIKRYPVSKRSSDYVDQEDKATARKKTDPKVEKDLSNIFNVKKNATITTAKPTTGKKEIVDNKQKAKTDKPAINKELFSPVAPVNEKPLLINKKSIEWSDYFGLDRRKKSEENDLGKEWLIERYHKSISLSAKKRNAEIPLSSMQNNEELSKKELFDEVNEDKSNLSSEEQKIDNMDSKLKIMEDKIVDDALKYTGAHEGETDPKEIQEVKDRVISRLAAAYSLEKMRNALDEYKLAVAKERERLENRRQEEDDYSLSEEKRSSVPRKQVVDKDRESIPEGDNAIKCTDRNEDCHEQNYRTPSDITENYFGSDSEMNNNSWFSPNRHCNFLFLTKAYELCNGNMECQGEAQRAIHYLLDVSRFVQSQLSAAHDCLQSCPQTDTIVDPSRRR